MLQLTKWGLLDAVVAAGTPAVTTTSFDYGCQSTTVTIRPAAGVSALYAPRRTVLDALLVDAAVAAGAEVAFGVTVTGVLRDGHGRVNGVAVVDGRRVRQAYAPLVVGADGVRSTVADAVGAPVREEGEHAGALWMTYVTGLANQGYRWFYRPGAAFGLVPTNDGATCVFGGMARDRFTVPARRDRWESLLGRFDRAGLACVAGELRSATRVGPVRGWPGVPGRRRAAYGPGWALVGDAGYYKDPIGVHGITQALRDAQLLADAVVDGALPRYERLRDELSAGLFSATDAIAAYDWDPDRVQGLVRRLISAMSRELEFLASE
ncbi:hypothetical protein Aph01nite_30860 [Acrocarpospora phusangensis]|uniref:FAD-binding domain-containing protein n=1 Tax=Acrocarpospora phusangensis TaxID=1070424 RepID=A0A919Q9N4_9ACTN|nr:hypothetical protein Aph01nite_30860 [Acrocarpospora phusangensis]